MMDLLDDFLSPINNQCFLNKQYPLLDTTHKRVEVTQVLGSQYKITFRNELLTEE